MLNVVYLKTQMTTKRADLQSGTPITSKITFFMMVTDSDLVIADYAIKSYARIKNIDFRLQIYSNWVSSALKQTYLRGWERLDYVDIVKNEWQEDDKKPSDLLDAPFERYADILDRELKKMKTPYFATVDADFEILDASFVPAMLAQLDVNPKLVAISTDYSQTNEQYYDSYSQELICLNERWHTWFCIYKREALQCNVSHAYFEEITDGPIRRNAWDSMGYFQRALIQTHGWQLAMLDKKFQPCFIHYEAFAKNREINDENVALYRRLMILKKRGLFGYSNWFARKVDQLLTKQLARLFYRAFFSRVDRSRDWPGWGDGWAPTCNDNSCSKRE
jgi:hypothetical protein